jgi:hypothetical protein
MDVNLNDIYKKLSIKYNIPIRDIELVCKTIFELTAETMREGKLEQVFIPNLGKFVVPIYKLKNRNNEEFVKKTEEYYRRLEEFNNKRSQSREDSN